MIYVGNGRTYVWNGEQNEKFRFRKSSWVDTAIKAIMTQATAIL